MATDRTTKILLLLIFAALCALLFRQEAPLALAQSGGTTRDNPAIAFLGPNGSMAYVVSGGKISFWETDTVNGKPKLVMYDSEPLPAK